MKMSLKVAKADCRDGLAMVEAADSGHVDAVRLLLKWREHSPRAGCRDGQALITAAARGLCPTASRAEGASTSSHHCRGGEL